MARQTHHLEATERQGAPSAIRRRGLIPAILYGHGAENRSLALDQKSFGKVFKEAGYTTLVNVTFVGEKKDGQAHKALIREVQVHPVRGTMLHVDLYQVRMDETIRANAPLAFTGEAPAVKDLGGVLVRNMDEVELEALPDDLPHDIEVDVTTLSTFDSPIRIKDLRVSSKVRLLHEPNEVIVLVQPPRTEEELEAELAEEVTEDVAGVEGVAEKAPEDAEAAAAGAEDEEKAGEQKTDAA